MLTKTKGIVFSYIKYKESSIIVKIFTRELGVQSYIVNSVRTKSKTNKISFYQPLSILELVVYSNPKTNLHRISEAQFSTKFNTIAFDVKKTSINLFLAECMSKMMMEQEENKSLFDFLEAALIQFDDIEVDYFEYHIFILLNLYDYLGHSIPLNLDIEQDLILSEIKNKSFVKNLNRNSRTTLLNYILDFYKEHSQLQLNLKSLPVLEAIFD